MSGLWPWPADTPVDIARRLLQSYREALQRRDPEACSRIDAQAQAFGQGWVVPRLETVDVDALVSGVEAAELAGVEPQVIWQWAYRGHIPRRTGVDGSTCYRVGDVLDHQARQRRRRGARRRRHADTGDGACVDSRA
ncbi:hypothetical protein [Prescottella equi]|uniref:hypothetical protein n=1 Tax=Rhodococcus hoagii TaxID=43767 RepID=UPI0007CD4548|nr:hypothetical protein [Prescottella equi]